MTTPDPGPRARQRSAGTDTPGDLVAGGVTLPRPPGVLRRFWARHPRTVDVLLVLFWGVPEVISALSGAWQTDRSAFGTAAVIVLSVVAVAGIPVRRTHPAVTVVLSMAAPLALLFTEAGYSAVLFGVYAATVYWSTAAGWWSVVAAQLLGVGAIALRITVLSPGSGGVEELFAVQLAAFLLVAVLIGVNVGSRRRYTEALIDRARQLARERDQQAQIATAAERARIAREMHDVVSHSVTVMVRLAEGAEAGVRSGATDAALGALRGVADVGRGAMTDMRRMLGVLGGDGSGPLAPQPAVRDLPDLVDGFRALGLPVSLDLTGAPPEDDALQLAVHRVVQESLTNAVRYAVEPRSVSVRVQADPSSVVVLVTDDGRGDGTAVSVGSGSGLVGLRERVAALGGALVAGRRDDGPGWQVRADIPVQPADHQEHPA